MTAKQKAAMLDCGHFSLTGKCDICADRKAVENAREAARAVVNEPDPTRGQPATAPDPGADAGWPTARKVLGDHEPTAGVYDLPDSVYYADPLRAYGTESLSATSHRHLVAPSTPAHYRWAIDHPGQGRTDAMIFGKAFHAATLETADLAIFDGRSWDSKAGQAFLAAHDPDGDEAPVLAKDVPVITGMAKALREHPIAKLGLTGGRAEQALFGHHDDLNIWLRCKLDYLTERAGGHIVLTDIKSTTWAHESVFVRSAGKYAYDLQADNSEWLVRRLGLAKRATMIFAAVEAKPPHLVAVHQFDSADLKNARRVNEAAETTFARCLAAGEWPGYPKRINKLSLPPWEVRQREEAIYDTDDEGEDQ